MNLESKPSRHHIEDLVRLFNKCFQQSEQTILIPGADEPLYLPAKNRQSYHELHTRADYFASGLHEIAHWCIAGKARRQQVDFGYWYEPDGRSVGQQSLFEQVEAKPQALEWIFSKACGYPFRVSVDNLEGECMAPSANFVSNIAVAAKRYLERGLPPRAGIFAQALFDLYQGHAFWQAEHYPITDLTV